MTTTTQGKGLGMQQVPLYVITREVQATGGCRCFENPFSRICVECGTPYTQPLDPPSGYLLAPGNCSAICNMTARERHVAVSAA